MESLWEGFVIKEKALFENDKRQYFHFDLKINFASKQNYFNKFLFDTNRVAKHSFFPLIKNVTETPRYKEISKGIRKIDVKRRDICYSSHFDSVIYSWYSTQLANHYEQYISNENFRDSVSAYRKQTTISAFSGREIGKCNIHYAKEVFDYIKNQKQCVALAYDVEKFFDTLNHNILKTNWAKVMEKDLLPEDHLNIFKSITKFNWVDAKSLQSKLDIKYDKGYFKNGKRIWKYCTHEEFRTIVRLGGRLGLIQKNATAGIPQGLAISATLSNIYMLDFDKNLFEFTNSIGALYKRYCDDIVIICQDTQQEMVQLKVKQELDAIKLISNEDKIDVVSFRKNSKELRAYNIDGTYKKLQYLGFEFDGSRIYIRTSSFARYYRRMKARIREDVRKAFGKNLYGKGNYGIISKAKILDRYSYLGESNFITYVKRAYEELGKETSIRRQCKRLYNNLHKAMSEKLEKKIGQKEATLKKRNLKKQS